MRKTVLFLSILALVVSCKAAMEPIRVQLPGTYWSYTDEDGASTSIVGFPDEKHMVVLQLSVKSSAVETLHGTYTTDGHRVEGKGESWGRTVKLVRTFSHLKTSSTNENMTPLYPKASPLAGSVWGTLVNEYLHVAFFTEDSCYDATYRYVARGEGQDYGWEWKQADYTLNGNQLDAASFHATLYDSFMMVDTLGVFRVTPAVDQAESSALKGTVWANEGYPGLVVFTSASDFVRITVYSKNIFLYTSGTYELQGTSLSLRWDDIKETCQIEGGRFTIFNNTVNSQTYSKVTFP
ncbi:MAG: hypothetical protein J5675_04330 [Bacteroidales bacterium]|nr:hypothetical protein [Bacteroidales bacterium]